MEKLPKSTYLFTFKRTFHVSIEYNCCTPGVAGPALEDYYLLQYLILTY